MNKKTCGALALSLMLGLASCSDEAPWSSSDSEGGIKLELSADGRVMQQTRADDAVSPIVPETGDFAISLKKADGSFSQEWRSVDAFNNEAGFPIGDYTLAASYGSLNQEGFTAPYFYGQTTVHVAPASLSEAQIVATLGNAMVSVRYSDKFKSNFAAYSSAVQTEGHDWIIFAQNEDRPAYITPGDVKLNLTLTNLQGQQVTIQPAGFTAQARRHYLVKIDADDSTGDLLLNVVFEEDVVNETVNVNLGDELFNAPEPSVTAKGFEDGVAIDGFEYSGDLPTAEFNVFAFGGLKETTLNFITDDSYTPTFGKSVQLVNASSLVQQQLASEGIDCAGFFRNVDKMGVVNVTEFLKKLPAGSYTIQLNATDAMTRVSPDVKLMINLQRVEMAFGEPSAVEYGATEVTVDINTNCPAIKDEVKFKAPNADNKMVDVTFKSVSEVSSTRALAYTYRYVLEVDAQTGSKVDVQATLGANTIYTEVPVNAPDIAIQTDAFAQSVVVKFSGKAVESESVINGLHFYLGSKQINSSDLIYDAAAKTVTVGGLTQNTDYSNLIVRVGNYDITVPAFKTEYALAVPNGNFDNATETMTFDPIDTGGRYSGVASWASARWYQLKSGIHRSTPDGWATVNAFTCYSGSATQNTWFLVPSTYVENGQTIISSVGYSHTASAPTDYASTAVYYNRNSPSNLDRKSGELFLGKYSYDGNESREDGIEWTSRPLTLSFDYSYTPDVNSDEQAEAYVYILGASGQELAKQVIYLDASESMKTYSVALTNYPFGVKAAKIKLGFKSTKSGVEPSITVPTGDALKEGATAGNFTNPPKVADNEYKAVARGSMLVVDNVTLGYDPKAAATAAKAKKNNKRR